MGPNSGLTLQAVTYTAALPSNQKNQMLVPIPYFLNIYLFLFVYIVVSYIQNRVFPSHLNLNYPLQQ